MPCLGSRKKKKAASIKSNRLNEKSRSITQNDTVVAQMKQEYHELKSKNDEHLDVIARQSAELAQLRQQLDSTANNSSNNKSIEDEEMITEMEKRNKETLATLQQKEHLLEEKEREIQLLLSKMNHEEEVESKLLAEKEELLQSKEEQIKELQLQWQAERAELIKPALEEVSAQLDQLKKTNDEAQKRLADKEAELAELRSELTRRDRTPKNNNKSSDQERQKRLNRLTIDLENDRLMIQKLEDLNQQLEAQKKQHEAVLETHAQAIAEKDRELVLHQQSLMDLKKQHQQAMKTLEQNQSQALGQLTTRHEHDLQQLKQRLVEAEKRAKNDMNNEVEKLLREFEQSEHDHSQQVAYLQKSHREQLSSMKQDQQKEIRQHIQKRNSIIITNNHPLPSSFSSNPPSSHYTKQSSPSLSSSTNNSNATTIVAPLRKTGGPGSKVFRWPTMPSLDDQPDLLPKNPHAIHVYVSSVSANSTVKRNQEAIQTLLSSSKIQYKIIDVAKSEPALQHMRKETNGKSTQLPLVFVGGHYRGQYDDIVQAQDTDNLFDFLSLSKNNNDNEEDNENEMSSPKSPTPTSSPLKHKDSFTSSYTSPNSSTTSTPLTTPTSSRAQSTCKSKLIMDDHNDAELLQELEKELNSKLLA
ncbi:hypothetical protein BJ944DRAFT_244475 [Cunninghamella echinulata]|nr:hypothetical protein BJ944DRAFT_244475 [Cunninghamella echinulata]